MTKEAAVEKLTALISDGYEVKARQRDLSTWYPRCELAVRHIFPDHPRHLKDLQAIAFAPDVFENAYPSGGMPEAIELQYQHIGVQQVINKLELCREEIQDYTEDLAKAQPSIPKTHSLAEADARSVLEQFRKSVLKYVEEQDEEARTCANRLAMRVVGIAHDCDVDTESVIAAPPAAGGHKQAFDVVVNWHQNLYGFKVYRHAVDLVDRVIGVIESGGYNFGGSEPSAATSEQGDIKNMIVQEHGPSTQDRIERYLVYGTSVYYLATLPIRGVRRIMRAHVGAWWSTGMVAFAFLATTVAYFSLRNEIEDATTLNGVLVAIFFGSWTAFGQFATQMRKKD